MMKVRNKKAFIKLFTYIFTFLLLTLVTVSAVFASEKNSSKKIVKVGYYESKYFQEGGSDDQIKDGYSYAYLHKISNYTGWEYEYVYGNWVDLYRDLLTGKIDVMAGITKSYGRSGTFLFPDYPMGSEGHYIYKRAADVTLDAEDIMTVNGKKIGAIRSSELTTELTNWANANNIKCDIVTYESFDERDAALKNGEVDALVAADNNISVDTGFVPFLKLSDEKFYLAVAKGRNDLLEELNAAALYHQRSNPNWLEILSQRYFNATAINASLTSEEKEWISEYNRLKVGYIEDYLPFCDKNQEGKAMGIMVDVFTEMSHFLGPSLMPEIIYEPYPSYDEMMVALKNSEIDVAFPIYNSLYHSEEEGVLSSDETISVVMNIIYAGEYNEHKTDIIAVSGHSPTQFAYAEMYYPDSQIYVAKDAKDCLEAIKRGDANSTFFTSFRTKYFLESEEFSSLNSQQFVESSSLSLAVNKKDSKLLCVINKALSQIDTKKLSGKLFEYSEYKNFYTMKDFIQDNMSMIIFIALAVAMLVAVFVRMYILKSEKYEQAQEEANYDALTNVRNKGSFMRIMEEMKREKNEYALILIDVDNFKSINDTYGHEVGDKALIKLAKNMVSEFRNVDYTFRIGGDEFAVIMIDSGKNQAEIVTHKIAHINAMMSNSDEDVPSITLSVGVAFSDRDNPTDNIFNDADSALYQVKENGRNGCRIY